jgi:DNA invertase Pin-like site-specific DNA recombinase
MNLRLFLRHIKGGKQGHRAFSFSISIPAACANLFVSAPRLPYVSTVDQNPNAQRDALKAAGCEKVVTEKVSGASTKRPKLDKLLSTLQSGDVLTVWRLDRVGRSLPHLLDVVGDLKSRGIGFQSLNETIDTTTANGELIFHLFAALTQFERSLIVERTQAGLKAARKRGVRVGRPPALSTAQVKHARKLIDGGERPSAVAASLGVNRSTLYRAIKAGD